MASRRQRIISFIVLLAFCVHFFIPIPLNAQTISIEDYLLPDEQIITLSPGLMYNGRLYEIHYFTTGEFSSVRSSFIGLATAETFAEQQITGLLITADGEIVEDEGLMREVLLLYRAAYYLYDVGASSPLGFTDFYPYQDYRSDLQAVTENWFFIEQQIKGLFSSDEEEAAEALRGITTAQLSLPEVVTSFQADVESGVESLGNFENVATVFDDAITLAKYSNDREVRLASQYLRDVFDGAEKVVENGSTFIEVDGQPVEFANALDIIELGTNIIWTANLQQERAQWLVDYSTFAQGGGALEAYQQTAIDVVSVEAEEVWIQRTNIILDFLKDQTSELLIREGSEELIRRWIAWSWNTFGKRTKGHLVAGAASQVTLGLSISNYLYSLDELVENFVYAERSDELREKFYAHRLTLQEQVRFTPVFYDAELARQFRITFMLEQLSAAQSFRYYSDGVEATVEKRFLSFLNIIRWLEGKEWAEAAEGLRQIGNDLERDAYEKMGDPDFLDTALSLIWQRLAVLAPPLGSCDINGSDGVDFHESSDDDNEIYVICVDLTDPYLRFQTTMANEVETVNPTSDQRETVQSMVIRPENKPHHPVVAINADYFGAGHGPEGFTVVAGERLDGPENGDCDNPNFDDCRDNAIYRPSLSISRVNGIEISHKEAGEVGDGLAQLSRFYKSVGAGPTLVTDGRLIPDPCPPEGFSNLDECRQAAQTAVGVSQDGNTLILIVAENKTGRQMGELLMQYGAYQGMKLDGGSSSQLWYRDNLKLSGAAVANALLIFREEIPRHNALILEQSQFPVLQAGEPFSVTLRLGNTGFLPWEKDFDYALQHVDGELFSIPSPRFITATVPTGYDLAITLEGIAPSTPGAYQSIWQLVYQDSQGFIEPVSEELGFLVTVVPEGTSLDFTDSLQQFIDQFLAEIEGNVRDYLDELAQEVEARIAAELLKLIPPELQCLLGMGMIFSNGWFLTTWRRKRGQDE